jgi:hypothetical protein
MSAADDQKFVPENEAGPIVDDKQAEREDAAVAKSEETGKVTKGRSGITSEAAELC